MKLSDVCLSDVIVSPSIVRVTRYKHFSFHCLSFFFSLFKKFSEYPTITKALDDTGEKNKSRGGDKFFFPRKTTSIFLYGYPRCEYFLVDFVLSLWLAWLLVVDLS